MLIAGQRGGWRDQDGVRLVRIGGAPHRFFVGDVDGRAMRGAAVQPQRRRAADAAAQPETLVGAGRSSGSAADIGQSSWDPRGGLSI